MPTQVIEAAGGGSQFDYTTGFDTFTTACKTRVNTLAFRTAGAITSWSLSLQDPDGNVVCLILGDTSADLFSNEIGDLPIDADARSYQLRFVTVGMADAGTLMIASEAVTTGLQ
jgi:hypothetical protein